MDDGFRRLLPPIDSREGKEGKGREGKAEVFLCYVPMTDD
jgi:hypothetical protein